MWRQCPPEVVAVQKPWPWPLSLATPSLSSFLSALSCLGNQSGVSMEIGFRSWVSGAGLAMFKVNFTLYKAQLIYRNYHTASIFLLHRTVIHVVQISLTCKVTKITSILVFNVRVGHDLKWPNNPLNDQNTPHSKIPYSLLR